MSRAWAAALVFAGGVVAGQGAEAPQVVQEPRVPFGVIIAEQARASFTLRGAGARAAGMGGAFTAVADDATAASFNPAGLAQLRLPEISVVYSNQQLEDRYTGFISFGETPPLRLTDSSDTFSRDGLNFVSATLPFRMAGKHWAVQLSEQRMVNFDYDAVFTFFGDQADGSARLASIVQSSQQSGSIKARTVSLALEVTDRTLLGVAYNSWDGQWDFTSYNARSLIDSPDEPIFFGYTQASRLRAQNLDLGLLLRYTHFRVGVRYRRSFEASYSFSGDTVSNLPLSITSLPPIDTRLHWPSSLNIGVSLQLSDRWLMALDWGRTDWKEMTFDPGDKVQTGFFDLLRVGETTAGVSSDWRIGSEYLFFVGDAVVPVRAGVFREPRPSRDLVTRERLVRRGFSVGAGIKWKTIAADLTVSRTRASAEVSRFFMPSNLDTENLFFNSFGNLEKAETTVIASLILQIPEGSRLSRVLGRVFVGPGNDD
ncbi:MAG TPA: hypothetical protein ENK10_04655 [Acidobacteria bacterium]|nr:hypothetical protein [Acidobacteriota bacterium]